MHSLLKSTALAAGLVAAVTATAICTVGLGLAADQLRDGNDRDDASGFVCQNHPQSR